ncbi:hypothetical protein E2C01_084913 [Portunus trituberculatus]|uniref:Uncharacterized protein n=1 Tax=Portunus trituberculatus TaxID=210409 RepID=A0A5B7J5D6_PORTR|nr:hypothetical protein [Portunus trituberculatus]
MDNGDVSVGRGRLQNNMDDCEEEDDDSCHKSGPVTLAQWPRQDGSRLAFGRLKAKLFETRLAAHVRRAQLAITDSIKHAGWAVEHKVGVNCGLHCEEHARGLRAAVRCSSLIGMLWEPLVHALWEYNYRSQYVRVEKREFKRPIVHRKKYRHPALFPFFV